MEVVIGKVERVGGVESGRVDSVVLASGRVIESEAVVLALGPWSAKLEMLSSVFRVLGVKAHSIVLEPKEGVDITPHAVFLSYYCSDGGAPMDPEVYPRPTGKFWSDFDSYFGNMRSNHLSMGDVIVMVRRTFYQTLENVVLETFIRDINVLTN